MNLDRNPPPLRALLPLLCAPMFLVLLDVLAMNVAMPALGKAFSAPESAWAQVVDAYTVPLAVLLIPAGFAVDAWGVRRTLIASLALFTAASAGGMLAPTWETVLLARTLQGAAAAVMLPAGLAAIGLSWSAPASRARALGIWSSVSAIATAAGPAVGGILVAATGWRAVFAVNVPIAAFALIFLWRIVPDARPGVEKGRPTRMRALVASVIAAAIMTSGANGTLQVVTIFLQRDLHVSASLAGLILLLATVPFVLLGPLSGRLVTRFGRRGTTACGFGTGALALVAGTRFPGPASLAIVLLGVGIGIGLMTAPIVGESLAAWPARPGLTSGLNNALRQLGTSAGVALATLTAEHSHGPGLIAQSGTAVAVWWIAGGMIAVIGFRRVREH